ncbi:tRNA (guanine-N1)-methyltransferase [Cellulophaga sp. HaHaR_3_176]|uniref:tRNA (guanine-N1)-methyltransferase n=1 Tax=Cellulophaga sp. HaHaR_3_176 TaxID=1942464 RepID=UPI001C1FF297|nr:tRNA (guanine-N1)-methyltransferase [Cellulophaga sp. HaHaR_3_176]QWX82578.1 tRNA (guanine-N1)-methyltransferase [Cellulophaga sp. HaHaR_3_176]
MKKIRLILLALTLLAFNFQYAQTSDDDQEDDSAKETGSVSDQFEYLAKKSGNYRAAGIRYEVVKVTSFDKLRENVADTLSLINKKTAELKATISESEKTIISLNDKLSETSNNLTAVTEEKDSISFFGILISKSTYNAILWTLIAGLLLLLLFFIYRFRNSNILTQEAKTNLSELEVEYEEHRRRALEREQKISRQYQDEINKNKKAK